MDHYILAAWPFSEVLAFDVFLLSLVKTLEPRVQHRFCIWELVYPYMLVVFKILVYMVVDGEIRFVDNIGGIS